MGFHALLAQGNLLEVKGETVHILTFPSQSGAGEINLNSVAWEEVDSPTNLLKTEIQNS